MLAQRMIVSVIALTAIIVGVAVALLFMLGYRLDRETGRLEQGALLQFETEPTGAAVWIDGKDTGARTGTKRTVLAGAHEFMLKKDGYEDWTRTITVKAGTLTWLDYARLVPRDRKTEDVASYSSLVAAKAAPGGKSFILQESKGEPTFTIAAIDRDEVATSRISLDKNLYGESDDSSVKREFRLRQWDQSGRYVIVTHHYGSKIEWLVVDTEQVSRSENVTRKLSVNLKELHFVGNDGRTLVGLMSDGIIRKLDLGSETISRALVTNVTSFSIDPGTKIVNYVGVDPQDSKRRVAGVYRDGDASSYVLRGTVGDSPLLVTSAVYHGNNYVAIAEGGTVTLLRGSYPKSLSDTSSLTPVATMSLEGHVTWLSFSSDADFLVAQSDKSFVGYEIEQERSSVSSLIDGAKLRWLDAAYLWDDLNGTVTMRDFDGSNSHQVMLVAEGFDVALTENGRYLYGIGERDNGYALQRFKMIID